MEAEGEGHRGCSLYSRPAREARAFSTSPSESHEKMEGSLLASTPSLALPLETSFRLVCPLREPQGNGG